MNFRNVLIGAAVAAFLVGCGGGGGGGGDETPEVLVEGAAVKGLVRNADVRVFELPATSVRAVDGRRIGEGATDSQGRFSLSVSGYAGGPVLLQIKGRSAGTDVRCDALPSQVAKVCGVGKSRGDFIPVGPDFELESYLPQLSSGRNTINASALTSLLGSLANAKLSTLDTSQALAQALSQVRSLAGGIDVVATTPVDLTEVPASASAEELAYAALNAAVLSFADDGAGSPQAAIQSAIDTLSDEFKDGSIEKGKLASLVATAQEQLDTAGKVDLSGVLASLEVAAQGDPDEPFEPEPVAPAETAVATAKAFVEKVRGTVRHYEDVLQPDATTDQYVAGLEEAAALAEPKVLALFESLGLVVDEGRLLVANGQDGSTRTLTSNGSTGSKTATLTLSRQSGVTSVLVQGNVQDDSVDLRLVFPTDQLEATGAALTLEVSGTAETVGNSGAKLTVSPDSKVVVTLKDPSKPLLSEAQAGDDAPVTGQNIQKAAFHLDATLEQKGGKAISFQGLLGATVVRCDNCVVPQGTPVAFAPTRVLIRGIATDGSGNQVSANLSVALEESSAKTFNYAEPYTATNFLEGVIVFSFKAKLPASVAPETQVTAVIESRGWHNASEIPIGRITVTFAEGSTVVLTATGENRADDPVPSAIELRGGAGVVLRLVNKAASGADIDLTGSILTVDGTKVAEVNQNGGLITLHYEDGSFETLFN